MIVSLAKIAEMIEMSFGFWTHVGPRNHMLDGDPDPPMQRGNVAWEKRQPIVKYTDTLL